MIMPMRWLIALGLVAGCGPVAYVNQVTRTAGTAVDEARAAHAEKLAPYWWTRATQYLHMAREVAGHADFQGANHFGRLAADAADHATAEAKDAALHPANVQIIKPHDTAPAKDDDAPVPTPAPAKGKIAPAKDAP